MISTPTLIVAYLVLFGGVGFLFVFGALLLGRFLRPKSPTPQKLATYECGEPAVGSSYVQFDLRFYVVALLFIIFDVEVAFFFPWATVFGKATQLTDLNHRIEVAANLEADSTGLTEAELIETERKKSELIEAVREKYRELGIKHPQPGARSAKDARNLALTAMADISVFFAVLLVGFAYVWKQGDLNWVRAFGRRAPGQAVPPEDSATGRQPPAAGEKAF